MAVPKSKISKSKRGMRRAHADLKSESINECPNCGEIRRPHHVCPACGFYNAMETQKNVFYFLTETRWQKINLKDSNLLNLNLESLKEQLMTINEIDTTSTSDSGFYEFGYLW